MPSKKLCGQLQGCGNVSGILSTVSGEKIKYGDTAYWQAHRDYVPRAGEIIIVTDYTTDANGVNIPAFKVGDGAAYCVDLPVVSDDIRNMILSHVNNPNLHVTQEEKTFWNNKWSGYIAEVDSENLVFTIN